LVRKKKESPKDYRNQIHKKFLTPFKEKCGFEFTLSQKKVIREIFADMTSEFPMNRLLQGDVGSGKTIVALCAMLLACENDLQSVLMAPTEILAEQHYITMKHFLKPFPLRLGLLTGSASGSERKKFLEGCANGEIHMAIGTHALLDKKVQFKRCGLVVIDEQHRFGVKHRLMLAARKPVPDTLVMTATPIPRTLALGLYGDLDISVIEDLPPGRQKIETWCKNESESYQIVKSEVDRGRQAYIVYPLVDESDKVELKSAIREFEKLVQTSLKGYSVGLLHGQMSGKEKEKVMTGFYAGNFSILVATTVIEVGIDVPNATVMVIQNAERFGLATLHQLRGRVGRGKDPSYCVLVIHQEKERSNQRIQTFLQTQNGFQLAESDLKLRGPGEIFGTSQHGVPPFKVANFLDGALVSRCQKAARDLVQSDPRLEKPENRALRDHLRKHFSKTWYWANIA
ncbi:MAG: ATP-dependent DNA helicase RecG, partial [Elusimicrobia bacterium]|nr:ATP-dependent DNA helicase RecG [Elusimicrobiota bacterium]